MPVFFVDICLNNSLIEDEEGIEFPSIPTAEAHCIAGLLDVAKRLVTASTRQRVTTTLRDEVRNFILERTMTFTCEIT